MTSRFTFFWKTDSPFSQWHNSPFKAPAMFGVDTTTLHHFCNAEQWMMYNKALLFGDTKTASEILQSKSPAVMKKLGRQISPFHQSVWDAHKEHIVYQGNLLKFSQSPRLLAALQQTQGTTLVEASPHDCVWGIGLRNTDPRAQNTATWRGQNLLGAILTQLRDREFHK